MSTALDNSNEGHGKASAMHAAAMDKKTDKQAVYNAWADKYDQELAENNYMAPKAVAKAVLAELRGDKFVDIQMVTEESNSEVTTTVTDCTSTSRDLEILDAGCGTGLFAEEFFRMLKEEEENTALRAKQLNVHMSGCDISPEMMKYCFQRGYHRLDVVDMNKSMILPNSFESVSFNNYNTVRNGAYPPNSFHIITVVGTFNGSHVKPTPAIPELMKMLKPGGVMLLTLRTDALREHGFAEVLEELKNGKSGGIGEECDKVEIEQFQFLVGVVAELVKVWKKK